ncbi:MAG TPA: T9SS type A sorting domain-containing protein [Flavobacteriales bacterium]|nr:T9SS type A sorting domain-containing protein [Flavobacteriales bacterium]
MKQSKLCMQAAGVVAAFLVGTMANAQNNPAQHQPPQGELYQVFRERMARIDSLKNSMPDSVVYSEGGELNELMRWYSYWQPRLAPHGDFDNYERMVSAYWEREKQRGIGQRANEDPWHEIGPTRRRNQMLGIGPIRSIAISDVDPDYMLCTSNSGGVFYTTNATTDCYWQNAGTDTQWPRSGAKHAAFYPGELNQWFAVNGERLGYTGGIRRKMANSNTWDSDAIFDRFDAPEQDINVQIVKLLFDRKTNLNFDHRLFACTSRGLYFSDDPIAASPGWTASYIVPPLSIQSAYPNGTMDMSRVFVNDVEYLTIPNTSTLCAAMRFTVDVGSNGQQIVNVWRFMQSADNGGYWQEVEGQPQVTTNFNWSSVEVTADAPANFFCKSYGPGGWVKSYNPGIPALPWSDEATNIFQPGSHFGNGHAFAIDQFDRESLFVGNYIDITWYRNGAVIPYPYPGGTGGNNSTGHDDTECILSDPNTPGLFWVGHHGGVSRINTNGTTRSWLDRSDGLGVAETWSFSTSQNKPDYIALGLYHYANILTRVPYAAEWDPDWDYLDHYGDGTLVLINPKDANTVYFAEQGDPLIGWKRIDNAESTVTGVTSIGTFRSQYYGKGDLHRTEPNTLFRTKTTNVMGVPPVDLPITNYENEIFKSDRGTTGTEVQISDFANNVQATRRSNSGYALDNEQFLWIKNNPANPEHLYASQENWNYQARLWRTTIANSPDIPAVRASWHEVAHPRRADLYQDELRPPNIAAIGFDTEDENHIYISYNGSSFGSAVDFHGDFAQQMVFRLNLSQQAPSPGQIDCSTTPYCDDLTMNLPNTIASMNGLAFEQGSDGGLYIATDFGIYFTNNKRISAYDPDNPEDANEPNSSGWIRSGTNLPHVGSNGLEINYQVNKIRVGLYGRGAWEHDLYCPTDQDLAETGTYGEDSFLEASSSITSDAIVAEERRVHYRAGESVRLQPGFHAQAGSRFHAFIHPCNAPGNSFNPKKLPVGTTRPYANSEPTTEPAGIVLSPNPAQGLTTVTCQSIPSDAAARLRLFDARGRVVRETIMKGTQHTLDLVGLHGLYVVLVVYDSAQYTARLSVP